MVISDELRVFTGNAHPELAKSVCSYLNIPFGQAKVFKFSNGNSFVQYEENIRERDVFIVQPAADPVNDSIMELLIMIDAAKRASARRITAVMPYYGYGRTDKKDQPRVPITAKLIADLLTVAGAQRLLTVDLHAGQIQGFFNIPVDELTALNLFVRYFHEKELVDPVVVAVDIGISKRARNMAERLNLPSPSSKSVAWTTPIPLTASTSSAKSPAGPPSPSMTKSPPAAPSSPPPMPSSKQVYVRSTPAAPTASSPAPPPKPSSRAPSRRSSSPTPSPRPTIRTRPRSTPSPLPPPSVKPSAAFTSVSPWGPYSSKTSRPWNTVRHLPM